MEIKDLKEQTHQLRNKLEDSSKKLARSTEAFTTVIQGLGDCMKKMEAQRCKLWREHINLQKRFNRLLKAKQALLGKVRERGQYGKVCLKRGVHMTGTNTGVLSHINWDS